MKQKALRATAAASILALAAGSVLFIAPAEAAGALTSAKQARAKALAAAPGTVISVKKGTRSGYPAWAVSITRSDGSIVVGYVDVKNGIAFDWTLTSSPGAPVIDLDGNDAALVPADPPKPPSETSSLSPVTGLGPGVEAPCSVSSVTGLCAGLEVPPGVSPVTGLGPGASLGSGSVSPVTGLGPAAGAGSVSPVTGLGPVTSAPVSRSPLTGL
ncbi:MAG: hypothetical protein F2702_07115 [Actinobacteria bacterium]|uniref:Unannotated protein n=1 Tax=freshwater metagenome TaxID=449393 RepID=A0A6J6USF3_9ZZZZ|nr:hypothetical protein [Actinomycetota bacterium]